MSSDILEPDDNQEPFDFPPPERRIVTQSYDLSVQTLVDQWQTELLVLPEMQREYVWDNARASRLVESLILNIPIPSVYFSETTAAKFEIIDGHQRIRSIVRYLGNEFALSSLGVLSEYRGLRFFQLPDREQRFIRIRSLRAVIVGAESHPRMKYEIFERLNRGSVALNEQELRNSLYRGSFNQFLRRIVLDSAFREAIGTPKPRRRMVDEELVLRFAALDNRLAVYRPPLVHFLSDFMREQQNAGDGQVAKVENRFIQTIEKVFRLFGSAAFRVTDAEGVPLEPTVNRALYDAQMLTLASADLGEVVQQRTTALRRLAKLYEDTEFDDSIRLATGDRSRLLYRVGRVAQALESAGIAVTAPTFS